MFRVMFAAAISAMCFATAASAETIYDDPGGEVPSYVRKYQTMRAAGERIVIDGPCRSACTLLIGIVPRDHVCVTPRAAFVFHAATYYNDTSREMVPSREGTQYVAGFYPTTIRAWIARHGGLTSKLIEMSGADLQKLYSPCR
jgi:hypothetical protein